MVPMPDPRGQRKRAVAICLVGLSPAVVTETLYALAVTERPRVVPAELHIITTRTGLAAVASRLLGAGGALHRLRQEYRLPRGAFRCPAENLHVLADARGDPLDDIVTGEDSQAVGEQIARLVEGLAADAATILHCSLAGGRKTMGALLATALQLYGRPGDCLYHVLVSPPFDRVPDFFFPTRRRCRLAGPEGPVDATRARVSLATVPIVRLGTVVRDLGLTGAALARVAADVEADAAGRLHLDPLRCEPGGGAVEIGGHRIVLPPQQMALYLFYLRLRGRCRARCCALGGRCAACHLSDDEVHDRREELVELYREVRGGVGLGAGPGERGAAPAEMKGFHPWLQQMRSRINARIREALGGGPRAARYAISEAPQEPGAKRRRGLGLRPHLIRVTARKG
jgi:CRISPR-associated protein (TIGR02584 family)